MSPQYTNISVKQTFEIRFFTFFSPYEPDDRYHYQDRAIFNARILIPA